MAIKEIVERVGHYLPSQGPLDVFIHHNTLHAFQHLPFEEGVEQAAALYGAEPYLTEERYLEEYKNGRITRRDLTRVIQAEDGEERVLGSFTRQEFRLLLLLSSPPEHTHHSISWRLIEDPCLLHTLGEDEGLRREFIEDTMSLLRTDEGAKTLYEELVVGLRRAGIRCDESFTALSLPLFEELKAAASDRFTSSSALEVSLKLLWLKCLKLVAGARIEGGWERQRVEGSSLSAETEERVNHLLIKFTSSYLDRGISYWRMPHRKRGYLHAFLTMMKGVLTAEDEECASRWKEMTGEELLEELLRREGVSEERWEEVLLAKGLALKGWAGMVHTLEHKGACLPQDAVPCSLADYLAVRILLERGVRKGQEQGGCHFVSSLDPIYFRAFHLFLIFRRARITAHQLRRAERREIQWVLRELEAWNELRRRRAWHHAFEEHFEHEVYNALLVHNSTTRVREDVCRKAQLLFCIDDREESLRRYIEAEDEGFETLGAAGFFGVDVEFKPLRDKSAPFCPPVITPKHRVMEVPGDADAAKLVARSLTRVGRVARGAHLGSHTLVRGGVLSSSLGFFASLPLALRLLSPSFEEKLKRKIERALDAKIAPELIIEGECEGLHGYAVEEMVHRVANILRSTGLTHSFAPLVVLFGHGSFSKNNPLKSAYDCGACGGRPGKINPRVFALMANRSDVRALLAEKGINIPDTTYFVGAYHNTTSDEVEYYDVPLMPRRFEECFHYLRQAVERALGRNALERCRRFHLCDPTSASAARHAVQSRSYDVREPRPEYGHATNAICMIGRRESTKGLFLDRRSFLISYDSEQDAEGDILLGLLSAVIPVCAGINLEYFFSAVDNGVYGAGSKLPHNVASLLGVMNGWSGDLRTGLPQQMVEIHEPVRLVTVIESNERTLEYVLSKNPALKEIIGNQWIRLALYDRERNSISYLGREGKIVSFKEGRAPIPHIRDIDSYISGKEEHLRFATLV